MQVSVGIWHILKYRFNQVQKFFRSAIRCDHPELGHALTPSPRWCLRCQVPLHLTWGSKTNQFIRLFFSLYVLHRFASICVDLHCFVEAVEAEVFFMHVLFASFLTHTIFKSIKWPCLSKSRVFLEI
jgi:hypothetical protein